MKLKNNLTLNSQIFFAAVVFSTLRCPIPHPTCRSNPIQSHLYYHSATLMMGDPSEMAFLFKFKHIVVVGHKIQRKSYAAASYAIFKKIMIADKFQLWAGFPQNDWRDHKQSAEGVSMECIKSQCPSHLACLYKIFYTNKL